MPQQFNTAAAPRDCPICLRTGSLRLLRHKPEIYECGRDPVRGDGCFALFRFGSAREGLAPQLTRIPPLAVQALNEHERKVLRGEA